MATTVEVRPVVDPEGRNAVLLQLEDGWLTLPPRDARRLAASLLDCADEVESIDA